MRELYAYFRSSAAYRVRIALALKELAYQVVPIHLLRHGGEQHTPEYRHRNPEGLVPAYVENDHVLTQSLAIMEYLEEAYPKTALLPADTLARARVRALALHVACDIHPLNNLRVLRWLANELQVEQAGRDQWYRHWVELGFEALEAQLQSPDTGLCCHGDTPGMADCCLVPQVYNARRFDIDISAYPTIARITEYCESLPAFQAAHPDKQPDAA